MKKIIVGLLGETGSGKDTVAEYLKKEYGAKLMRFADPIKETLSLYFDKLSKSDQQWLYLVFKERFGEDILSRAMSKRIEDNGFELVVINGLRMPSDYDFVKKYPNSYVLYITLNQKTRWQRTSGRGEKSDDKISFENFQKLDRQETEIHIPEVGKRADKKITNDKDLNHLLGEVDKYMSEIGAQRKFKEIEEEHEVPGEIPKFE